MGRDKPPPLPAGLDIGLLKFPMDSISIGAIRRKEPELLGASYDGTWLRMDDSEVAAALSIENKLACNAYCQAMGAPPMVAVPRAELIEMLNGVYVQYGISGGELQTAELVRDIERQAMAQFRGRAPGR